MALGRLAPFLLIVLCLGERSAADEPPPVEAKDDPFESELVEVQGAHKGLVRTLAFHPTRPILATGGSDRALRIWDPGADKPRAELVLPRSG